jgi:hypothetical protein
LMEVNMKAECESTVSDSYTRTALLLQDSRHDVVITTITVTHITFAVYMRI